MNALSDFPVRSRRKGPLFPFPALLLDLSLTTARGRVLTEDWLGQTWEAEVDLASFSSATGVVDHFMETVPGERPRSLIIAFPGSVLGFRARYTNSDWIIDCMEISKRFGFENGLLLNDQEAAAFSIPDLGTNECIHVGSRVLPSGAGPEVLISIRHGLGVASLRRWDNRYVALASEAGHVGLSPANEEEDKLFHAILSDGLRLSAERLLYHPGLRLVHDTRMKIAGRAVDPVADIEAVADAALKDPGCEEGRSILLFAKLLASYAGDVALSAFATGGVIISGGVLRKIAPLFQQRSIRDAFENKPPMRELLQRISFRLALIEDATLRGLTVLVQSPEHFGLSLENRCWRDSHGDL
jgi:glucokinase